MEELVGYIIVLVIGIAIGWFYANRVAIQAFANVIQRLGVPEEKLIELMEDIKENGYQEEEESSPIEDTIEVRVEQVDGVLYAYNDVTQEFLAQHSDPELLIERISQQIPSGSLVSIPVNKGGLFFKDIA